MTSGLPARPRDRKRASTIRFRLHFNEETVQANVGYLPSAEAWIPRGWGGAQTILGVVVYAHANGSFSVWDSVRNYSLRMPPPAVDTRRRPAYVFTETEIWDGLRTVVDGRAVPLCNGLLHDWSSWIKGKDPESKVMAQALRALSPDWDGGDRLEPGPPMRLSIDDARDIPSIQTSYAGAVPILHASSGIRRVVALAYILTWAWNEHRIVADRRGEDVVRHVTMLFDEVESHLHPRWQRSILKALRDVGEDLLDGVQLQLIASTHSAAGGRFRRTLVRSRTRRLAGSRSRWRPAAGAPASPFLHAARFAGAWLTSEAFDLKTERGSMEAEQAVLRARELLRRQAGASLDEVMRVHTELRGVLPDVDRFWVRWNAFVEDRGGTP